MDMTFAVVVIVIVGMVLIAHPPTSLLRELRRLVKDIIEAIK